MPEMIDRSLHEALLQKALQAARAGGREILAVYNSGEDQGLEYKQDESPLTKADRAAHIAIMAQLHSTGLPVLSEEGRSIPFNERVSWRQFWMVDPLDGTKEFIRRNGEFTVNVALIEDGQTVLGVVYVPVSGKMYWGARNLGAWQQTAEDEVRILRIAQGQKITGIVASRSHINPETQSFLDRYPEAQVVSMGSSLKFMAVAGGEAQLYPRFGPTMEWDTAAAQAIVEAAGGKVVTPEGIPLSYNKRDLLNPFFLVCPEDYRL